MKVKKTEAISLTASTPYVLVLNGNSQQGDTVARELVFSADGSVEVENASGTQKVINVSTLDVEEYSAGWAIIPCEGLPELTFTASEDCELTYQILV